MVKCASLCLQCEPVPILALTLGTVGKAAGEAEKQAETGGEAVWRYKYESSLEKIRALEDQVSDRWAGGVEE